MKIVQVINAMISNQDKIENVLRKGREYFFIYNKKFKWSITKNENTEDYYIHFYPTDDINIKELANISDWSAYNDFVTYSTTDIKTNEALESFRELYQIASDKLFGIDDIFNEIIGDN